ncbi:MAG: hypothetical protein R2769_02940 [Saprospiraceae bacterium]
MENLWGRPVDLEVMPDGSMLVCDDLRMRFIGFIMEGDRKGWGR